MRVRFVSLRLMLMKRGGARRAGSVSWTVCVCGITVLFRLLTLDVGGLILWVIDVRRTTQVFVGVGILCSGAASFFFIAITRAVVLMIVQLGLFLTFGLVCWCPFLEAWHCLSCAQLRLVPWPWIRLVGSLVGLSFFLPTAVCAEDVCGWPYSVGILVKWIAF